MKQVVSFALASILVCVAADAQGLKGAPELKRFGQPPYLDGHNDADRWRTLLAAEEHLIGSTAKEVERKLGHDGWWSKDKTRLEYQLTGDEPVNLHALSKDRQYLHLIISFKDGTATKFAIESRND